MNYDLMKLKKIVPLVFGYGVLRKIPQLSNATVEQRIVNPETSRGEYVQVPLLMTQKAMIACLSGINAMWMCPYYMYQDTKRIERWVRGIPPPAPRFSKTMILDFVFE